MKIEIQHAVDWWTSQLRSNMPKSDTTDQFLEGFQQKLSEILYKKFENHWYETEPMRGSGYRSVLSDSVQKDSILLKAFKETQHLYKEDASFESLLPNDCVMFINPDRVVVKHLHQTYFSILPVYIKQQQQSTTYLPKSSSSVVITEAPESKPSEQPLDAMEEPKLGGQNRAVRV